MKEKYSDGLPDSSEDISFKEFIIKIKDWYLYLKSRWHVILLVAFLGGIFGFFKAYLQTPKYIAELSFILEGNSNSNSGLIGGLASQFGVNLGSGNSDGLLDENSLAELFKSRTILEKILLHPVKINNRVTNIIEWYIEFNNMRKDNWLNKALISKEIKFPVDSDPRNFSLKQNRVLGSVVQSLAANNINLKPKGKNSSIYEITVKSENELFSKTFLELLVNEVSNFYAESKTQKASKNVNLLQKQTDSVRSELNEAIGAVAFANDNTYNLNPALNIKKVTSTKRQIDVQANTAILTQLVQNLEIAKMNLLQETPIMKVLDKPVLPLKADTADVKKSILIFFFLGLFLSVGILVGVKWWSVLMKND